MKDSLWVVVAFVLILVYDELVVVVQGQTPDKNGDDFDYSFVAEGFDDQLVLNIGGQGFTDLNWLPDGGELLITEKDGRLLVYPDFQTNPSSTNRIVSWDRSSRVCTETERGLQSLAIHPDFGKSNRFIYLFYNFSPNGNCEINSANGPFNRVSRFVMGEDYRLSNERVILEMVGRLLFRNFQFKLSTKSSLYRSLTCRAIFYTKRAPWPLPTITVVAWSLETMVIFTSPSAMVTFAHTVEGMSCLEFQAPCLEKFFDSPTMAAFQATIPLLLAIASAVLGLDFHPAIKPAVRYTQWGSGMRSTSRWIHILLIGSVS